MRRIHWTCLTLLRWSQMGVNFIITLTWMCCVCCNTKHPRQMTSAQFIDLLLNHSQTGVSKLLILTTFFFFTLIFVYTHSATSQNSYGFGKHSCSFYGDKTKKRKRKKLKMQFYDVIWNISYGLISSIFQYHCALMVEKGSSAWLLHFV